MKKILLSVFLLLIIFAVKGQSPNKNSSDLAFLYQTIQKLPSYKDQVGSNPKLKFDLGKDFTVKEDASAFDTFLELQKLISPIRDNHLAFYTNRDSVFTKPQITEISKARIDSAMRAASPSDRVTGTYYAGNYQLQLVKMGEIYIAAIENDGRYFTQFILREIRPNHFDLIGFAKNGTSYFMNRNVVFINQRLSGTPWKKYTQQDFISIPANTPKYDFKKVDDDIAYLRLGSFGTSNINIAESVKFYNQIGIISAKHLIVDLRENGGGGYKTSKKFLDLVKRFKGNVHLIVNNYTVSNAEQFTIDLIDKPNVSSYGETTKGTICYGNNAGTVVDLPSKRFSFYITDMKARKRDIPFESVGIKPKIELDIFGEDWIAQVVAHIKQN